MSTVHDKSEVLGDAGRVKHVAIVGASGNVGSHIVTALLAKGWFNITAISRTNSKAAFSEEVAVARVDYEDLATVVEALTGKDVLIITLSVFAARDTQSKIIRAAAEAGVPWVLPNEFGMYNTEEAQIVTIGPGKSKDRELIESLKVSSWIGITCGFWYEHSLSGPGFYGIDVAKREVVFFDEGTQRINTSTWPQVGRAVASILSLPIGFQKSPDVDLTLSSYRNRMVYVSSFALSQRAMFDSLKRVTGSSDADWSITSIPANQRFDEARRRMLGGDRSAFGEVLYTRYFYPGEDAGLFEKSHGLDNARLALPEEELDEATKAAIDLGASEYWKTFGKH